MAATEASAMLNSNPLRLPRLPSRWVVKSWTAVLSDLISLLVEVPVVEEAVVAPTVAAVEAVSVDVVVTIVEAVVASAIDVEASAIDVVVSAIAEAAEVVVAASAVAIEDVVASAGEGTDEAGL